jgi:GTP-binding protein
MFEFLAELGIPTIVVAMKVDKLRSSERTTRIPELAARVGVSEGQVIPFSAVTGEGRDELAEAIVGLVSQPSWRAG